MTAPSWADNRTVEFAERRFRRAQLLAAFWRGYRDCGAGRKRGDNPYPDKRTSGGHTTFSRAYRNAWDEGFVAARDDDREGRYPNG